jgi:hypothetical protein
LIDDPLEGELIGGNTFPPSKLGFEKSERERERGERGRDQLGRKSVRQRRTVRIRKKRTSRISWTSFILARKASPLNRGRCFRPLLVRNGSKREKEDPEKLEGRRVCDQTLTISVRDVSLSLPVTTNHTSTEGRVGNEDDTKSEE